MTSGVRQEGGASAARARWAGDEGMRTTPVQVRPEFLNVKIRLTSTSARERSVLRFGRISTSLKSSLTPSSMRMEPWCQFAGFCQWISGTTISSGAPHPRPCLSRVRLCELKPWQRVRSNLWFASGTSLDRPPNGTKRDE